MIPVAPFGRPVLSQADWLEFREPTGIPVVIDGAATFEAADVRPEELFGEIPSRHELPCDEDIHNR